MNLKLDKFERRINDKVRQYHNDIITKLDGIIKELEIAREDRALAFEETRTTLNRIENHKKRITKLEKLQQVTKI